MGGVDLWKETQIHRRVHRLDSTTDKLNSPYFFSFTFALTGTRVAIRWHVLCFVSFNPDCCTGTFVVPERSLFRNDRCSKVFNA